MGRGDNLPHGLRSPILDHDPSNRLDHAADRASLSSLRLTPGTLRRLPTKPSAAFLISYPAVQNIMLAARALGIGSCLTTIHRYRDAQLKELLGIPPNVETAALIPRYPLGKFGRPPRRPLREVAFADRWGQGL